MLDYASLLTQHSPCPQVLPHLDKKSFKSLKHSVCTVKQGLGSGIVVNVAHSTSVARVHGFGSWWGPTHCSLCHAVAESHIPNRGRWHRCYLSANIPHQKKKRSISVQRGMLYLINVSREELSIDLEFNYSKHTVKLCGGPWQLKNSKEKTALYSES